MAELQNRLRTDPVPAVRAASATALARSAGLEERGRLIQAARADESAKVRVAALEALATFGENEELGKVATAEFQDGYSWKTMGAAAGLYVAAVPDDAYAWLTRNLLLDSPHDVLRAELIEQLGKLDEPGVVDQLIGWARDSSADSAARAAAAKALATQRRGREAHRAQDAEHPTGPSDRSVVLLRESPGGFARGNRSNPGHGAQSSRDDPVRSAPSIVRFSVGKRLLG